MIEFNKVDLARLETVMKALKRGKYELEGDEVLAFSQSFAWLSSLFDKIQADILKPKIEQDSIKEPEPKANEKKTKK
jgi:hypothetical protein